MKQKRDKRNRLYERFQISDPRYIFAPQARDKNLPNFWPGSDVARLESRIAILFFAMWSRMPLLLLPSYLGGMQMSRLIDFK
jgi:hypothetical protein